MGKLSHDRRDIYYRKAKQEGYRARSAYKLLDLESHFEFLKDVNTCVDLCAAPGSWSQVLSRHMSNKPKQSQERVIAIDLQEMMPIQGVKCIQGDITEETTAQQVIDHFQG